MKTMKPSELDALGKELHETLFDYGLSMHPTVRKDIDDILKKHIKVLKEPQECDCKGWGCMKCCSSMEEIRQRQGIFS